MALSVQDQAFLHTMVQRRFETERETTAIYNKFHEGQSEVDDGKQLEERIAHINKSLELAQIQLRKGAVPPRNEVYWGVVNVLSDKFSEMMTLYSPEVVAVFFGVVQKITTEYSEEGALSYNDARNIGSDITVRESDEQADNEADAASQRRRILRPQAVQEALALLDERGWLKVDNDGRNPQVYLGVRSFLELPEVKEWYSRKLISSGTSAPTRPADQSSLDESDEEEEAVVQPPRRKTRRVY